MARLRNRIVKADYWTDSELLRWSRDKRESYRGLWAVAEDSGCLEDDPWGWKLLIWPSPLDADITAELLEQWRDELIEAGKLVPYQANGKRYLWIRTFHDHEKPRNPQSPNLPLPPWVRWIPNATDPRKGQYNIDTNLVPPLNNGCTTPVLASPPSPAQPRTIDTFGTSTDADVPVENSRGEVFKEPRPPDKMGGAAPADRPDLRTDAQRLVA